LTRVLAATGAAAVLLAGCSESGSTQNSTTLEPPPSATVSPSIEPSPSISAPARQRRAGGDHLGATTPGTVPPVVFHGPRNRKRIALTFDSNMTDTMLRKLAAGQKSYANKAVIDQLQRMKVPATFFLAGKWVQAYPELTKRLAADPSFEIASHSWSHEGFRPGCYDLGTLKTTAMAADVVKSFEVIDQYTDNATRYFRFPGGCYDQAALRAIAPAGCTVVQYDVASGDAFGKSPEAIAESTVAKSRSGSIVVLHITEANSPYTDEALPTIVTKLRARGYELVTLTDLLRG
jgi:peptidoglycan/xylan/chitin deacetylase (PgdA/CDA1 family)